jgi:PIN domain nuclease of toxin-antitoxin system
VLPILPAHTAALIGLPFHHRDPFDRLPAAQALIEDIPLVSTDAIFDQYGIKRVWA